MKKNTSRILVVLFFAFGLQHVLTLEFFKTRQRVFASHYHRHAGVTIVGTHASEIIAEFILAMKHNLGLNKILSTIHIYPTMAEANQYAAGMWEKAHAPEKPFAGWSGFTGGVWADPGPMALLPSDLALDPVNTDTLVYRFPGTE